jgi:hypothetical protein
MTNSHAGEYLAGINQKENAKYQAIFGGCQITVESPEKWPERKG